MLGIIILAGAYILSHFYRSFLAVLSPQLTAELGLGPDVLSDALGAWFAAFALAQFPVGSLLDRVGPRWTAASMFAIGAGGGECKGYMQGTQSKLDFLPEMHTDFIFTILGEEFGLYGALVVLGLYLGVFFTALQIALSAKSHFGRLLTMGIAVTFLSYVLINTGMVIGLAPVVGVPLPLISYGGTVMLSMMGGFGLVMSAWIDRSQDTLRTVSFGG